MTRPALPVQIASSTGACEVLVACHFIRSGGGSPDGSDRRGRDRNRSSWFSMPLTLSGPSAARVSKCCHVSFLVAPVRAATRRPMATIVAALRGARSLSSRVRDLVSSPSSSTCASRPETILRS